MPRHYPTKKKTINYFSKTLTIQLLKECGYLDGENRSQSGNVQWMRNGESYSNIGITVTLYETTGQVRVFFTKGEGGNLESHDYTISLTPTPCYYGGQRWWFIDPCSEEGAKCLTLYLQSNGMFAGRKSLNLSYTTRNTSRAYRILGRIFGVNSTKAEQIATTIKYPYRDGKPTKKMRKYVKLSESAFQTEEELYRDMRKIKVLRDSMNQIGV